MRRNQGKGEKFIYKSVPATLAQKPLWRAALMGAATGKVSVASHKAEEGCGENFLSLWSWGLEACIEKGVLLLNACCNLSVP